MNKVWLVTGASRGLGRAIARAVVASGDRLVATARDVSALSDIVGTDEERAISVPLDVTDPAAARRAVERGASHFGRIDVLVNNAGYANVAAIEDVDERDFRVQLETNFFGVFHVTRAVLPVMRAQRDGHIVQISTSGARFGTPGLGAYQSAKWAVEGLTEVLAREVGPLGIKTTLVEPGGFRTDWAGSSMHIGTPSEPYEATVGMIATARKEQGVTRGDPDRAAAAILRIVREPSPPLRLLLGTDAVFLASIVAEARAAEDARFRELAMSTDFDGQVPFESSELGKAIAASVRS